MIILKVLCEYSHLDGSEILKKKFQDVDKEIYDVIFEVIGEKSKVSKEKNRKVTLLYSFQYSNLSLRLVLNQEVLMK